MFPSDPKSSSKNHKKKNYKKKRIATFNWAADSALVKHPNSVYSILVKQGSTQWISLKRENLSVMLLTELRSEGKCDGFVC